MSKRHGSPTRLSVPQFHHLQCLTEESLAQLIEQFRPLMDTLEIERLGWPGNISIHARRVVAVAQLCSDALATKQPIEEAMNLAYTLAKSIGDANALLAVWGGLQGRKQERQKRAAGGAASHAETNAAKAKAIEEWLAGEPHKRGDKKAFAYAVAAEAGVDQRTVYDDWLSRKSIEAFQEGN